MQDQLQRVINLVEKTGDRLIVFDSSKPDNIYVILSLKDYENLVLGRSEVRSLTEDELLDKINRDIAIWKSEQDFNFSNDINQSSGAPDNPDNEFNSIKSVFDRKIKKSRKPASPWSIPSKVKQHAEEIIEEDRQYLENVSF